MVTLYNPEKPSHHNKQEYISGNNAYMIYVQSTNTYIVMSFNNTYTLEYGNSIFYVAACKM